MFGINSRRVLFYISRSQLGLTTTDGNKIVANTGQANIVKMRRKKRTTRNKCVFWYNKWKITALSLCCTWFIHRVLFVLKKDKKIIVRFSLTTLNIPVSVIRWVLKAHRGSFLKSSPGIFQMRNVHWVRDLCHWVKKISNIFHQG